MRTRFFFKPGEVNVNQPIGDSGGFLVIYDEWIAISPSDTTGHDDLLEKIAAEHHLDIVDVKHNGLRFYYKYGTPGIIISGSGETDNIGFAESSDLYSVLIKRNHRLF